MSEFISLYSGSSGNSSVVRCGDHYLIIDMGKGVRTTGAALKSLGLNIADCDGILVTHEHSDHVKGLSTFLKKNPLPVYGGADTLDFLDANGIVPPTCELNTLSSREEDIGAFGVQVFPTSHDVPCVGYRIHTPDGKTMTIATDLGELVGTFMLLIYLFRPSVAVRFARLKVSVKSIRLTLRNTWYMLKLGVSSCLSEVTIAVMAIAGNYVFMSHLGTDGVAAYSIVCYLFPIIFMVFNAMVQSAQPIISYNYGCGQIARSNKALRLSVASAVIFALMISGLFVHFSGDIVSLFLPDRESHAWQYAVVGLPLFAVDYIFFGINVIAIGYYTSIERINRAMRLTLLRGVLPVLFFFVLPLLFGVTGIWLAVAAGDMTAVAIIVILTLRDKKR